MPIDRAKAIAEVGKVIVESAKAETAHLAVVGGRQGSGFIPDGKPTLAGPTGAAPAIEHKTGNTKK